MIKFKCWQCLTASQAAYSRNRRQNNNGVSKCIPADEKVPTETVKRVNV